MLTLDQFDYELPPELIAQYPADRRDGSRMLVLDPDSGEAVVRPFTDIVNYLSPGDLMVCNNTKVLRGRMYGRKNGESSGAKFELLLVSKLAAPRRWTAMLKPGKRARPGTFVALTGKDGEINSDGDGFTVVDRVDGDTFEIEFTDDDGDRLQSAYGHIPLPPYIRRADTATDARRYQTVFARIQGAAAAPTAGLHFSRRVLDELAAKGVRRAEVTLHVGPGTFKTVDENDISRHQMHTESFDCPEKTAQAINQARKSGKHVLAVGTTTVRTLESCVNSAGLVEPRSGETGIFLYPPYQIRGCDMLLTNFHLPKSTLLMLVSCFVGREKMLAAYELAKREKMRFYSYGDCMLILPRR